MMHTSSESQLLEIVEAIRMLTPDQRHRLQRRLRASGLLSPEEYVTDRNRLRMAPAVAASAGDKEVAQAQSATLGMDGGVFDADLPSDERSKVPPSGDDASINDASKGDGAYRSSVSGRVVVGSPTDANVEESPEMLPLPGQAPEQPIELIFDGGSRGNPGQGYGSYALLWPGLPQQVVRLRFGDKVTNNEAEYDTLITALEAVIKKLQDSDASTETAKLDIRGDSQLVVNQVLGHWECKEPHMQVRCDRARYLLQRFGNWQLAYHDRKESVQTLGH